MATVWPCPLGVDAYAAAGRGLEVPRLACPDCGAPMGMWGWYERDVRAGRTWRVAVRRQRCGPCGRSHAVLPAFVTHGRLDAVGVIGDALEAQVAGTGARRVAAAVDLPHTTVRDWRRRFRSRAALVVGGLVGAVVALVGVAPALGADPEEAALDAVVAVAEALGRRRRVVVGGVWAAANAVCGSHLLSTNTHPPWSVR